MQKIRRSRSTRQAQDQSWKMRQRKRKTQEKILFICKKLQPTRASLSFCTFAVNPKTKWKGPFHHQASAMWWSHPVKDKWTTHQRITWHLCNRCPKKHIRQPP